MSDHAPSISAEPSNLIVRKTGDWWKDDRRNWCAYCGERIAKASDAGDRVALLTRDHVISKAHKGRHVTIPSCRPCNQEKGSDGLPQFLLSDYFDKVRKRKRPNCWPLRDLWLVMALAAVEQARTHGD